MNKELLLGAAYYPEYMPYDRVDKDFQMMKDAGMNVVRIAESTWSTLEPAEGMFDFYYIDRVLNAAEQYDMQVIIGTPTYAVPSWLVKKDPDVMVTRKEGQALYGGRQIMDITNETYRYHAELVIRKLMEHTAKHEKVIGFQIDNETKHYGTASQKVQKEFVEYLKKKFGTTEKLNQTFYLNYWSNAIGCWEDFPDIRGTINAGLAGEFEVFQRTLAAQFLQWQASIVEEYKREDQFITHNLDFEWKKFGADIAQDGYSYGVQPDMNHYEASKCMTLCGTDIYHPTQDELTGAEIAFGGDSIRSLKYDNYLVLENQAQAFKYWTPYPGQLRLHAYSHLASGAMGTMYWNWHSIHNSYETYWKGVLSHDLDTNPAYEEIALFGAEWKKLSHKLMNFKKENRIALLVDNRTLTAFKWFPIDRDLSYNDVVRWVYDSLYELNLECDVVDVHALEESRYDMIVTPALYSAADELIARLDAFVKRGGVLVSTFKSFVSNEFLSVYYDAQPHGMTQCFGMSYNQFSEPGKTTVEGRKIRYFMEFLKADNAEVKMQYEHQYWGRYGAVTKNIYGEGKAFYIGCYLEKEQLKKILLEAGKAAGIERICGETVWPVTVRSGMNADGNRMSYLLHYRDEKGSAACPYECAADLLTGKIYKKGEAIALREWDTVILEEIV